MLSSNILNFGSFYFIGAGGVSMSALAKYLLSLGKRVGGCDCARGEYAEELIKSGAEISFGDGGEEVSFYDAVVYTDAVPENNAALLCARSRGMPVYSRGEFLAAVSENFNKVIAVSGCHGKTTCTAMLAHIFSRGNSGFACHIGGADLTFGNFYINGNEYFITEACEYKRNFLRLSPDVAVVLNTAADHMECYGTAAELKRCYGQFTARADQSVVLYGDLPFKNSVTFGFDKRADYSASSITCNNGKYNFYVNARGKCRGRINLNVYGKHNVLNALAAYAAADLCGVDDKSKISGLENFKGVKRRFQSIGYINGAECVADYAHHPDEIKAVLKTARKITAGKLYVVFQPHTYSRTKNLFARFTQVLSPVKRLLIYKTFAAREYYDDAGSALTLSRAIKKSRYAGDERDIMSFLNGAEEGDKIFFLGAGDIYYVALNLIKSLS